MPVADAVILIRDDQVIVQVPAPATAFESRLATLEQSALTVQQQLREWTQGDDYEKLQRTVDSFGVITRSTVLWPDDSTGVYLATEINSTYHQVDAYQVSHTSTNQTVIQDAVARDGSGYVITKPALRVVTTTTPTGLTVETLSSTYPTVIDVLLAFGTVEELANN